jgi:tetraprenyl-beta-curcumene synthase
MVASEVRRYTRLATVIPDKPIREDAIAALTGKRPHLDGAAMYSILPTRRDARLVRALVTYELILEFLDNMNERAASTGVRNGLQLHLALAQALDPGGDVSDYYRYHPWREDNGYLNRLVYDCRAACLSLPHFMTVRLAAVAEAERAQVLALNHEPDPKRRDQLLRKWVRHQYPDEPQGCWWELTGAATASLTVHALLALAAERRTMPVDIQPTRQVHRKLSLLATMLDSYVDHETDAAEAQHSYVAHYDPSLLVCRLSELIHDGLTCARTLRNGHRHAVIAASMVALYLSSDQAMRAEYRETTVAFADAGGSLTRLLLPALRTWRRAYGLRQA